MPKLRFPEFSGDWKSAKLKNISKEIKRTSEKSDVEVLTISAGKGFITQKERWDKVIAGSSLKKYIFLKENEFSYNRGNSKTFPYGCIYRLKDHDHALVPNVYRSFSLEEQNPLFYEHFFIGGHIDRQLNKLISSSARMDGLLNISKKDFFNVEVPVPPIEEQEKIGTFLSKVDEKILILEKKQELWESYKKGIMQQIFSQKLRFKDENGEDYPDWEEKRLEDVGKFISGCGFSEKYQGQDNLPIKFFKVSDMNNKGNEKYMTYSNNTVSESIMEKLRSKPIKKLGIIFAKVGAAIFLERKKIAIPPFMVDNNMMVFIENENVNIEFIYYFFKKIKISKYAQVGAIPSVTGRDLQRIKIYIPVFDEQTKITDFLSAVDSKIEGLNKELEINKEFKKGLLQQMFC